MKGATELALRRMRDLVQEDVGGRGLGADPSANLLTSCPDDFSEACRSIGLSSGVGLAVVTGFFIPHGDPPCGETDGPLGALFLARALTPLGIKVALVTDAFCVPALRVGLEACALQGTVPLVSLPDDRALDLLTLMDSTFPFNHLLALERVGPSHTPASLGEQPGNGTEAPELFAREVPPEHQDRCHNMRGQDITSSMSPAHRLFEQAWHDALLITIGIGDGGNEIGMGSVPWEVIRRNIPNGARIACRIPTDLLIVCGVSNWGAYALGAGVRLVRKAPPDPGLFDPDREQELLRLMVERGPLVEGKSGKRVAEVDGLPFEQYARVLPLLGRILAEHEGGARP